MRRYECVVILDHELPDDDIRNFTEKYTQLIKTSSGEVIKIEDWGIKRLAYLVNKRDKGRYILFDFVGLPALIAEMERQLKISDEVMKYMSVKLEDSVDLEAFKAAKEPPPEAPAAEVAPEAAPAAEEPVPHTQEGTAGLTVELTAVPEEKPVEEAAEAQPAEETKEEVQS